MSGGHRRYAEADVATVLEVLRHRSTGLALEAAIRRATSGSLRSRSIYAELRSQHPELTPQRLSKASLVAISHAIEDECCARAEQPLRIELARTARVTVVFADLAAASQPRSGVPTEVALPHDAPLNREWIVICDAPDLPACMAAVERPGQEDVLDLRRRFEMVWTVDPRAVRYASRIAAALAEKYQPGWRTADLAVLDDDPPAASGDLRRAYDLLNRMVGYLDARSSAMPTTATDG
jgi:DICT domain-containing protein